MSNRVSPEPVPFSDSPAPTQNSPPPDADESRSGNPSNTLLLQQINEPPSSNDSEYQPRIEGQESEEVEPAATYDPPDVLSARNAKSHEDWQAGDETGKSGGGEADEQGALFSRLRPDHDQQRREEEEEGEKREEENTRDPESQSRIIAGGVGGVSDSSEFPINETETSFDENKEKRVRPVGRLPPLGHSIESEEDNFGRVQAAATTTTTTTSKMSARPNSGISRKGDQAGVIGANDSQEESGCCAIILTILSYILVILFFPFSLCLTIKVVQEYERAVIFRLGRLLPGGAKGPGIFFVMPCIEEYTKVDLRTVSFDVPPQEVLTRDSVTVSVDAVVYYRISNPTVSVANVENAANSTQLLAQTTLRNVLGTQNLAEILSNREHISEQMQNVLDDATDKWGIKVERVEIKDVRLPTQLQRAMAAEAEAARDARAKVIAAEGEQKASIALKEAADIITDSPAALQLRYLQTLNSISAEKNSTIIFPLPIEMVAGLVKK